MNADVQDSASLLARAERCAAEGDDAGVLACHDALAVERTPEPERAVWVSLLAGAGAIDRALAMAGTLTSADLVAHAARLVGVDAMRAAHEVVDEPETEEDDDLEWVPVETRVASDTGVVELFLRWFGGRRDLYAKQWHDERRGRTGYHPVEEPLTPAVARAHLEGRLTLGQYLLFPDATCAFGVIDLDLSPSAMEELRSGHGADAPATSHPRLRRYAATLIEAGARLGLPLFAEDSGGRGLHLWLFVEPRRPARAVRAALGRVASAAGPQPPDVAVEVFPKQERLGPRGLSSLVKLPLGIHQGTFRRCPLLDDALRPIDAPDAALSRLRTAEPSALDAVLGGRVVGLPAPELDGALGPPPSLPAAPIPRTLAEQLRAIPPGGADEREACDRMLSGCAVLAALVRKAYDTRRLTADELRALLYSVGLVGPRSRLADELVAVTGASTKEAERVRRGLPSPVGCNRLRRLAPETAASCRCPGAQSLPYPTPALFAVGEVAPGAPRWRPFAPALEEGPLVQDPLAALAEVLDRIEHRLVLLEEKRQGP